MRMPMPMPMPAPINAFNARNKHHQSGGVRFWRGILLLGGAFLVGSISTATVLLNVALVRQEASAGGATNEGTILGDYASPPGISTILQQTHHSSLHGLRILIAIAAFDFSQLPHLEEVLDGYQDLCVTGARNVDIIIHATVAFPVTLIDLWNSRLLSSCQGVFTLKIHLVPSSLRLHLVDCHRPYFYEHIDDYDLFIYTEDDIRMAPHTVAAYLDETLRLRDQLGPEKAADLNVGIVRYEYNFPSNVVMDDKTRHATQNVTRVYWEHSMFPPWGKAIDAVPIPALKETHVHMNNHHQGMFLATRELLLAWKDRKGCQFDKVRNRPGLKNRPSQPSEGTQRVWMSSQMLYGNRHCGVQQVLPVTSFGSLTVLHLPNKNYRRVGHFRNRTFADGTETFDYGAPTGQLLTALQLHLELRKQMPQPPLAKYRGIEMVDLTDNPKDRSPLLERRMGEYQAYVDRGGVLNDQDMTNIELVEER